MARKMTIEKSAGIKIRTGNYETLDISQTVKTDVEFDTPAELRQKDEGLTSMLASLLKKTVEDVMAQIGRHRVIDGKAVELWGDTERGPRPKAQEGGAK